MDIEEKIIKKEKELKKIKKMILEEVIISQIKYQELIERQQLLEEKIEKLKGQVKLRTEPKKKWIKLEDGWVKRVYE